MANSAGEEPRAKRRCAPVDIAAALKDAGLTALIAFGLFLPLIGFQTVQTSATNWC